MGRLFRNIDWYITFLLLGIGIFGAGILLTVDSGLFFQQMIFLGIGFALMVCFSLIEPIMYLWAAPFLYTASMLFLFSSFLGPSIRGATRWFILFGTQFQPSELVKPFMLVSFAYFIIKYPPRTVRNIFIQTILFIIPFLIIFRQPDLGSGIVYTLFWTGMMVAGGVPLWLFGVAVALFGALLPVLWHTLREYQKNRILTFLSPALDPSGAGYNALQSMIAVGSGQLFGRGLGLGTQSHLRFLPEYHTDFIFATLVEELGFVGGGMLLLFYTLLLWRVMKLFLKKDTDNAYLFVFSVGLLTMMLSQIVINTGMNMGMFPITGITLPLVSYGGSSVLSVFSAFGIYMALTRGGEKTRHVANTWVN